MSRWTEDHVRHFMYQGIAHTLSSLIWSAEEYDALEFGSEGRSAICVILESILGSKFHLTQTQYPETDIQHTKYADERWDIVIADQVLEHVENPWIAALELARITRPGGTAIIATPFLHPIHLAPKDYWRFAPDGYRALFPGQLWKTEVLDMWGNAAIIGWEYTHGVLANGFAGYGNTSIESAQQSMPGYNNPTDNLNPVVIWWVGTRK